MRVLIRKVPVVNGLTTISITCQESDVGGAKSSETLRETVL